jgi:dolichol-phosphate mannosyltransferase
VDASAETLVVLSDSPSFAVVIPMFNEEAGAEVCVKTVCGELQRVDPRARLFVVEDGSRDRTADILRELEKTTPALKVLFHSENRGYGQALVTGGRAAHDAGFDYAVFMDSDLTNDPKDITHFLGKMREGADSIKASRYIKGGGTSDVPPFRRAISVLGNSVARILMRIPIHDLTNGFRAVRTSAFVRIPFRENKFAIIMEELYYMKRMGCSFAEVPNVLRTRSGDRRKTSFSYKPSTFAQYLKYPLKSFFGL